MSSLAQAHSRTLVDPMAVSQALESHLNTQLMTLTSRTLVLELNVARVQQQLDGDTPEARFQHFTDLLLKPEFSRTLWEEYPVMTRLAVQYAEHGVGFATQLLSHLYRDWDRLGEAFGFRAEDESVVGIQLGLGDRHRGGQTVACVKLRSGMKLVYKPKSMAIDVHFQELLDWLNHHGVQPEFPLIRIVDGGDHGWSEFVPAMACETPAAVNRFYQRQGNYLALLYALEATDFHAENLIARGEDPILVDLEALFHARHANEAAPQVTLGSHKLGQSVLFSGLLPWRMAVNEHSIGMDMSGLGGSSGQVTPYPVAQWDASGTDEMHMIRKPVAMGQTHNRPRLADVEVDVFEHIEPIASGFARLYQLLMEHRAELLAPIGPLSWFTNDEIRAIVRPTRTYAVLLYESFHPDFLRQALDRDLFFDHLWGPATRFPALERVISAECEDLWRGDIPHFTTQPGSRDIQTSTGQVIKDFYARSGLELARDRIEHLDYTDLEKQLWFIRAAFTTLKIGEGRIETPRDHAPPPPIDVTTEGLMEAALKVGDRLATLALQDQMGIDWIGVTLVYDKHWMLAPLSLGMYDGLAGIALFLGYLGASSASSKHTHLARKVVETIQRDLYLHRPSLRSIGAFSGWGGLMTLFTHLGKLWDDAQLLEQAEMMLADVERLLEHDQAFDILGGSAGAILAILNLLTIRPSKRAVSLVTRCGEHLIAHAQPMPRGIGWPNASIRSQPLSGFSHGAAGMALALLKLAHETGREEFRLTALQAIDYERSLFSPQHHNWRDLREFDLETNPAGRDVQEHYAVTWCHGAPGIGLARLQTLSLLDDDIVRQEIMAAVETTLRRGFGHNHCLCHGDLGNLELIHLAGRRLARRQWQHEAQIIAASVWQAVMQSDWRSGVPNAVETPGLMTGLAGIGYGLLRTAMPEYIPSLLMCEPPPS
jgi:type 2 lantibiotic biosynthesis protein LanM